MRGNVFIVAGLLFAGGIAAPAESLAWTRAHEMYQRTEYSASLEVLAGSREQDAAVFLLMGQDYFMLAQYKKASDALEKAAALAPQNAECFLWLGRAFGRRAELANPFTAPGYASKARQNFERAVALDPANREAVGDLFDYYLAAPGFLGGGANKAAALAAQVAVRDPAEGHYYQARLDEHRKEYDAAERHLRTALELAPRQVGRVIALAKYLSARGRNKESDALFEQAERIAPQDPLVIYERASAYVQSGRNLDEARRLLRRYLQAPITPDDPPKAEAESMLRKIGGLMFTAEVLRFSFQALRANKVRTFLTALGLVIGNASVILVVTISLTSRDYILDQIQRIGSNLIYAQYENGNNLSGSASAADYVKIADVDAVREQLGSRIVAATGVMNSFDRIRIQSGEEDVAIIGSDQYYPEVRNLDLLAGRFLDEADVNQRHRVALLMERLARRLFGSQSAAVGQTVKLHGLQFTVIGTFKEKTESFGLSELSGENVLIPITVLRYFAPIERIDPLYVQARSAADVLPLTDAVKSILESRHRAGAKYRVDNLAAILDAAGRIANVLTVVLILVSALALIISGIGIMNIMLVTVTERTREIGLRMAVGAARRDVLEQFLAEAVIISMTGGVAGILIGVAIPLSVRFFADDFAVPISPLSIAVAFTVSLIVGLAFGLLPANRASRLNPTEALRYE